jgi:hypothetical protein
MALINYDALHFSEHEYDRFLLQLTVYNKIGSFMTILSWTRQYSI